jgi:hypothetical protein
MREIRIILAAAFLFLLGQGAQAGYDEAYAALQRKDYATAHPLLLSAAAKGDARAWNALGVMYFQGLGVKRNDDKAVEYFEKAASAGNANALNGLIQILGSGTDAVPKDVERARAWAWKFAQSDNPYAAFVFYQLAIQNELSILDDKGAVNRERYEELAKRPMDDRDLDARAFTMLSIAAEGGYPAALAIAQMTLLERSGEGVAERALELDALIQDKYKNQIPVQMAIQLNQEVTHLKNLKLLGTSYVSPRLYRDALPMVMVSAYSGSQITTADCDRAKARVTKLQVSEGMREKDTVSIEARLLDDVLYTKGHWRELWTVDLCGKSVIVPIRFEEDGWAGAYFTVESKDVKWLK